MPSSCPWVTALVIVSGPATTVLLTTAELAAVSTAVGQTLTWTSVTLDYGMLPILHVNVMFIKANSFSLSCSFCRYLSNEEDTYL